MKIGYRVSVLDEDIVGLVREIQGDNIKIETTDGFEMVFNKSELLLIPEDKSLSKTHVSAEVIVNKQEKQTKKNSKLSKPKENKVVLEIDLHIGQLKASTVGMTKHDILTLQINTAQRQLEFAIKKGIQRLIFIHGVGEGVLKTELNNLLAIYSVDVYPASFQKYGFGATEVYIYQNASRNRH